MITEFDFLTQRTTPMSFRCFRIFNKFWIKKGHHTSHTYYSLGVDSLQWEAVQAQQLCSKYIFSGQKIVNYSQKIEKEKTQSHQIEHYWCWPKFTSRALLMTWKNLMSLVKSWSAKTGVSISFPLPGMQVSLCPEPVQNHCAQVYIGGLLTLPNDSVEPGELRMAGGWIH